MTLILTNMIFVGRPRRKVQQGNFALNQLHTIFCFFASIIRLIN